MTRQKLALLLLLLTGCKPGEPGTLTVCADPNNLPFSNRAEQGFENRIVRMVASGLGRKLRYVWWAQRRGYVSNTLGEGECDLWPGVATGVEMLATTRPYYRSSYMFVTRQDRNLGKLTLDDVRLKTLRIGVQMIGDDGMNTPPAHALAGRGIIGNVRGYLVYGDYRNPVPSSAIIDAVSDGAIDVALVWGPLAGWAAKHSRVPIRLEPVTPWLDHARWPMIYDISMGVRKDDPELKSKIEKLLAVNAATIRSTLREYNVPQVEDRARPDASRRRGTKLPDYHF